MTAAFIQWVARGLVGLAGPVMVIALLPPIRYPKWICLGLAALIAAAIATILRFLVMREAFRGRGGSILTADASPLGWLISYLSLIIMLSFLEWLVLHTYATP